MRRLSSSCFPPSLLPEEQESWGQVQESKDMRVIIVIGQERAKIFDTKRSWGQGAHICKDASGQFEWLIPKEGMLSSTVDNKIVIPSDEGIVFEHFTFNRSLIKLAIGIKCSLVKLAMKPPQSPTVDWSSPHHSLWPFDIAEIFIVKSGSSQFKIQPHHHCEDLFVLSEDTPKQSPTAVDESSTHFPRVKQSNHI